MEDRPPPSDYLVRFRPLAESVPPINRLRRLLKYALRGLGLRCVSAEAIRRDGSRHLDLDGEGEGI